MFGINFPMIASRFAANQPYQLKHHAAVQAIFVA
jgi:hypothetical protein